MQEDSLSYTLFALADPTRRAILSRLAMGEASATELAQPFDMTPSGVTKHLKVLERSGLIERDRVKQFRPARLRAEPLQEVAAWVERYRVFWEESFNRLDSYLAELQQSAKEGESG